MPLDGNGTYTPPSPDFPAIPNTTVESDKYNTVILDQAEALSTALYRDGQAPFTANLNADGFAIENLSELTADSGGAALTGDWEAATQAPGDSSDLLATTAFVAAAAFSSSLPAQTGKERQTITTDGTSASWSKQVYDFRATVASATTTADIWAAEGKQINWTGTVTCTGFPAAPQAGLEKVLICAAAAPFTAGPNMLIDGVASGTTVTCAANDKMIARSITTTQFMLSRVKADGTPQVSRPKALTVLTASGFYTITEETVKITVIGGGGGSAGTDVPSGATSGGDGGTTTVASGTQTISTVSATGGKGGTTTPTAGLGGVGSGGDLNLRGTGGSLSTSQGGAGGSSLLGGGPPAPGAQTSGVAGDTYGSGGSGPGSLSGSGGPGGGGGTAVKYLTGLTIGATLTITIGAGGAAGAGGSSGQARSGAAGAPGAVIIEY